MNTNILSTDSKQCIEFISKLEKYIIKDKSDSNFNSNIPNHMYLSQLKQLSKFAMDYIKIHNNINNNINNYIINNNTNNGTSNINIIETSSNINIYKSENPHIIDYVKLEESNSSKFIKKTGITLNDDINTMSEKISVSDVDTVRDFYDEAKNNYIPAKTHNNIYQHFCPMIVQYNIEQKLNYKKYYEINYNVDNINYVTKITYFTEQKEPRKKFIFNMVIPMLTICRLTNKNNMNIEYVIYATTEKKTLPKTKFIGSHSVNTGSTYHGNCQTVKLWRQEEIKKVAYHELYHCLALDFHTMPNVYLNKLKEKLNVENDINILLGESYVEVWANIVNCLNVAINISNTHEEIFNIFYECIHYEIIFSLFQTAKIINFFDYKSYDDFYNKKGFDNKTGIFKQNTCVMSYYIVKSALLYSIGDFMKYCETYNTTNIMQFIENDINFMMYVELIIKSMENKNFGDNINKMLDNVSYLRNNHGDSFIYKTLRMTCLEL